MIKKLAANLKNQQGFTLMEIVLSIAILSIAGIFILDMFVVSSNANARVKNSDIALSECISALESFKAESGAFEGFSYDMPREQTISFYYDDNWNKINSPDNARFLITAHIWADVVQPAQADSSDAGSLYNIELTAEDMRIMADKRVLSSICGAKYFPKWS